MIRYNHNITDLNVFATHFGSEKSKWKLRALIDLTKMKYLPRPDFVNKNFTTPTKPKQAFIKKNWHKKNSGHAYFSLQLLIKEVFNW